MKKIIFNHSYILKHDKMRTYIIASDNYSETNIIKGWVSKIHPIYAMILSLISTPCTIEEAIQKITFFLDISIDDARNILLLFLNAEEPFVTEYKGCPCPFPTKLIIYTNEEKAPRRLYNPQMFVYKYIDIKKERCYVSPIGIVFMVNNVCATNCIYCYADKQTKSSMMTLSEIEKMCIEAQKLGIASLSISGGEVFKYKEWYRLLQMLINYGYKPDLISTKMPLSESDIIKLKELDIKVQISLDAFDSSLLTNLLQVNKEYFAKIKATILLLEKYNVDFQIATIITNKNDSISNLETLYDFLSSFKNLSRWEIRIAFRSLYSRQDFNLIKVSKEQIKNIENWIYEIQKISSVNILWSPDTGRSYFTAKDGSKTFSGSRCSANYSHIVVLPDGKVTICEQLYWNPRFIIGNIKEQTIEEIWSSTKALALANIPQKNLRKKSVCSSCKLYNSCLEYPNKCYADVLKAYGDENWDYPDPRCNQAPAFLHDMD